MSFPKRPMIDAGFFILANRERPKDPRTEDHALALAALEQSGAEIMIAAPALAEIFRKKYRTPPPATRWPVVAFGRAAANLLGRTMPNRWVTHPNVPGGYWKYDLMIAACAVIAQADAIMVADADYTGILAQLDPAGLVKIRRANDIISMQVPITFPMQPTVPVSDSAEPADAPATTEKTDAAEVKDEKAEQAKPGEVGSTASPDVATEVGVETVEGVQAAPKVTPVPPPDAASELAAAAPAQASAEPKPALPL